MTSLYKNSSLHNTLNDMIRYNIFNPSYVFTRHNITYVYLTHTYEYIIPLLSFTNPSIVVYVPFTCNSHQLAKGKKRYIKKVILSNQKKVAFITVKH